MSYLRNQRRKGYPRQRSGFRDAARSFRLLGRAAAAAEERMRGLAAAFADAGWHGTDDPGNDPRDTYPGRYA